MFNQKVVDSARTVREKTFNIRDLSQLIEKEANIPAIQGMCVMAAMAEIIPRLLMDGNEVFLDGCGGLRASITVSNGEVSVGRIVFTPAKAMKEVMKAATLKEIQK